MKFIEEHYPANVKIEKNKQGETIATFLNDPKIDGALYDFLLNISFNQNGHTLVSKTQLPSLTEIGYIIGQNRYFKTTNTVGQKPLCRQTVKAHLNYLIEKHYLIDQGAFYEILNPENCYCTISLETLNFLTDTLKLEVIKTYLYLKQRWQHEPGWQFTQKEISEHLGLKYPDSNPVIKNYLTILQLIGLIEIEKIFVNKVPYFKLTKVDTNIKKVC